VQYRTIVYLFFVNEPHQCFFTLVDAASVPDGGDQTYGVQLQKLSSQDFIACSGNIYRFEKHFNVPNLEFPPKELARLAQDGDISLTVRRLSKKYPTLNFPAHSSDARAASLCTAEGDSLMRMLEFFLRVRVCQSLPAGRRVSCCYTCSSDL
jgi:hypothetical protein